MTAANQAGKRPGLSAVGAAPERVEERVTAADGRELAVTRFVGDGPDVVVLAGGVAIPRRYYADFAAWLSRQGPTVITFDYRGIAGSREDGDLRRGDVRFRDWGQQDLEAVLQHAARLTRGRVLHLGHSAGGQLLGLARSGTLPSRVLTVTCHAGWWGYSPAPERWKLWSYWYLLFPLLVRATGYLPGSKLGLGEDLPRGVIHEWMSWCRDRRYLYSDPTLDLGGFARVTAPIRTVQVTDDPWATRPAIEMLHSGYRNAPVELVTLTPEELGQRAVGHLGLFRADKGAAAWPGLAAWLLAEG